VKRRRPKQSLFTRVLAVMLVVGLVPLAVSVVTAVVVIGDDKEAAVIDTAVTRAEAITDQIDHATREARTQLHAAVLAADTGRFLDIRAMSSETVVAIRCLRDETEILEAAAEPNAHERLSTASRPEAGTVAILDETHAIVAERIGDIDAYALLDLGHELVTPTGWTAALAASSDSGVLGTIATRVDDETIRVASRSRDAVPIVLTAPLAPARDAAFATGRRAALYSLVALVPLLLLAWLLSRAVTSPVRKLAEAVSAAGDEEVRLPSLPDDEIGALGEAIRRLAEELRTDSDRMRTAVEFARRAGRKLEPERVLSSLERNLRRTFPDGEYVVLTSEMVADGKIPNALGAHAAVIGRSLGQRELGDESPGTAELCRPVALGDGSLHAVVMGDASRWHAIVVGAPKSVREQRSVELLCETAGAALRNNELVKQAMVNEKLTVLGRLAAGVAHEINNPLAYVIVNLRTLSEELSGEALETAQDALAGAERAARIVEDLSALHRGGSRLRLAKADLRVIAHAAAKIARARRPHVDISVTAGDELLVVCEQPRIEQALINLIINATDAVRNVDEPSVKLTVAGAGRRAYVDITDNGPGVPEDVREHLFDPFYTTKGEEGTGLGLFLARSFAEANRGVLDLKSTGAEGTTFRLLLPARQDSVQFEAPEARISRPPDRDSSERARILIIDDEPAIVRSMERWLGRRAAVTGVTDPAVGLELARQGGFALILCDMNMPNMTGREFIKALREFDLEIASRVVIVTGSGGEMPDDVLVLRKPLDSRAIARVLETIGVDEDPSPPLESDASEG